MMVLGIRKTMKNMKGGCCGGGGGEVRPMRKKLDGQVTERKVIHIEGMSCEHCRNRVERAINSIDGASGRVSLRKATCEVAMDRDIPDQVLKEAVEKENYRVTGIELRTA